MATICQCFTHSLSFNRNAFFVFFFLEADSSCLFSNLTLLLASFMGFCRWLVLSCRFVGSVFDPLAFPQRIGEQLPFARRSKNPYD
jgi:hypothetical protein